MATKISETVTENIFRSFYGPNQFIEKSAIPASYGFKSKKGSGKEGYPDFFCSCDEFSIIVEAKARNHDSAKSANANAQSKRLNRKAPAYGKT